MRWRDPRAVRLGQGSSGSFVLVAEEVFFELLEFSQVSTDARLNVWGREERKPDVPAEFPGQVARQDPGWKSGKKNTDGRARSSNTAWKALPN